METFTAQPPSARSVPAEFKVQKDGFITAWVPAGATTGRVSVVTPNGTLDSNPQFVVTK
jgi:hypothetical protein